MNCIRGVRYFLFQFSSYHRKIKKLKNKYWGESCFIVGNGPSLTIEDLNLIKREHCFAFNKIYEVFDKTDWRPEFYMVLDNGILKSISEKINSINVKYKFINIMGRFAGVNPGNNLIFFCHFGPYRAKEYNFIKKTISRDVSKYVSLNYTVACAAIEMAIYMGFKNIFLLGTDNNITKWIDKAGRAHIESGADYGVTSPHDIVYFSYYDAVTSCYECYKEYANKNGIKIINCTRGGKLEVFPRLQLEEVVKNKCKFITQR